MKPSLLRRLSVAFVALFTLGSTLLAPSEADAATRPKVSAVSVHSGSTSGGNRITIKGSHFRKVKKVLFGSRAGSGLKVVSSKRLTVVAPPGKAGWVSIKVVAKAGTSKATTKARYHYLAPAPAPSPTPGPSPTPTPAPAAPAPTIASVTPNSGTLAGGTVVSIAGVGFIDVTGVQLAGVPATGLAVASPTLIRVSTPRTNSAGSVDVKVMTTHGSATASRAFTYAPAGGVLTSGQVLAAGAQSASPNGTNRLIMRSDGNLVLYQGSQAKWSTGTSGAGNTAAMQSDGNLVVYSSAGKAVWSSGTAGFSGAALSVQDDGNVVIYRNGRAIWSKDGPLYDRLPAGWTLTTDQSIVSQNRQYTLIIQGDGNLVIYKTGGSAQWATSTSGSGNWAVMQGDGNLVVYTSSSKALWASNTAGKPGAWLIMQDDGNLVIYLNGSAIWDRYGSQGNTQIAAYKAWALNSANWNGKTDSGNPGIDSDGWYGAQCADLGIAWSKWVGHRVGFDGWDTSSASKPGWHAVSGNLGSAVPGDVITRVGGHQHVVVVTGSPSGGRVEVIQQNPGSPATTTYSTSTSGVIWRLD